MTQARGWLSTAMIVCLTHSLASTHREHKVHNIVLYPDKHSWCKTTPIKQVVAYPGCASIEIDNNVCVGACFSYAIPRTMPSAPGELIKPYCDSCQPSSVVWQQVTLTCETEENIFERVQMIENCSCSACFTGDESNDPQIESSGDGDVYNKPSLIDVPELMDLMMETHNTRKHLNESFNRTVTKEDPVLNERLLLLLKQFTEDKDLLEANLDKVALKELLRRVEGVDHRVNQVTLAEFVNWIEDTEHILVDLPKLKQILARFAHEESENRGEETPYHHEVHRHHSHHHHHVPAESHHHHHVPAESHHHHHHHEDHASDGETESEEEGESLVASGPVVAHEVPKEGGDPTLDVAPHHLKPALEGTELSYHENVVDDKHAKSEKEN